MRLPVRLLDPRLQRAAAIALVALVLLAAAGHAVLNSDAVSRAIRATALEKLQARLGPVALGEAVHISWSGEARLGPLAIPAGPGEPPLLHVDELRVRPSLLSLLTLHPELARVTLVSPAFDVDARLERLKAFRARLPHRAGHGAGGGAHEVPLLVLEDARLAVERPGDAAPLVLGPFDARVKLRGGAVDARLSVAGGSVRATGTREALALTFDALPLAHLAPQGVALPVTFSAGTLDGKVELTRTGAKALRAQVDLAVRDMVAVSPRLADGPVGPFQVRYLGTVALDRGAAKLSSDDSRLLLGKPKIELPFEATVALRPELRFDVDARLGPVELQALIDAVPRQLRPPPEAPKIDGSFRAEVRASGPARRPEDWTVAVRLDTRDLKEKARAKPFALREPFVYHPDDPDGAPRTLEVGPRNPHFVPLAELPPIVPAAVITSEDGNFFKHDGFDFEGIRDAVASAAEGERLRGGSTISQQLVKNLYLSRERTLARKVREAFITLQLEAALTKPRILEIYLNIIQWGPGVYGIGEAARYYFGVDARQLTPKQAVFLATLIPNPVKFSFYFRKGATSKNWDDHMAHLIEKLHERGDLDDAAYQKALADPVVFRKPGG